MNKLKKKEVKVKPVPEAITGEKWKVEEGRGEVSALPNKDGIRLMKVPLGLTAHEKAVRKHEYCHVRFTPPTAASYTESRTIQCLEDYRVNRLGIKAGINFGDGFNPAIIKGMIHTHAAQGDPKNMMLDILAGYPIKSSRDAALEAAEQYLTPELKDLLTQVLDRMEYNLRDFYNATVETAAFLDEQFEEMGRKKKEEVEVGEDESEGGIPDFIAKFDEKDLKSHEEAVGGSGKMKIEVPGFPRKLDPSKVDGRKNCVTNTGVIMNRPSRYLTDKKVFKTVKRQAGGTILIDVSSSMQLHERHIVNLIKKRPASTIAIYAGANEMGVLRIIVKKGMAAAENKCNLDEYGGNVIDYPALLWLAKQQEPHYWICDGYVTGLYDAQSTPVTKACNTAQKKSKTKRYYNIDDFLAGIEDKFPAGSGESPRKRAARDAKEEAERARRFEAKRKPYGS